MDDIKEFLKKYWPYVAGGIIGLYLLTRYSSSGSGGSAPVTYTPAGGYNAQDAMLQSQERIALAQIGLEDRRITSQNDIASQTLQVQKAALHAQAFNDFNKSQAAMAYALGDNAGKVIDALNTPALSAMISSATENAAAYNAIGNLTSNAFRAQSEMVAASSASTGTIGASLFNNMTRIPERATSLMDFMTSAVTSNSAAALAGNSGGGQNGFGNFMTSLYGGGGGNGGVSSNPTGNYLSAQNTTQQSGGGVLGMFGTDFFMNGLSSTTGGMGFA